MNRNRWSWLAGIGLLSFAMESAADPTVVRAPFVRVQTGMYGPGNGVYIKAPFVRVRTRGYRYPTYYYPIETVTPVPVFPGPTYVPGPVPNAALPTTPVQPQPQPGAPPPPVPAPQFQVPQTSPTAPPSETPPAPSEQPAPGTPAPQPQGVPAPLPPGVPAPLPQGVPAVTPTDFARTFQPIPGNYEVVFIHPYTGLPVKVAFALPNGILRRISAKHNEIEIQYEGFEVEIRFYRDGSVRVVYDD